jgi:hypothetical protein
MTGILPGLGPLFLAAEIDVFQPGTGTDAAPGEAYAVLPEGVLSLDPYVAGDSAVVRASDLGYVTRQADAGGLQVYPPILASGVELDRAMDLAPDGQGAAAGWGSIRLANDAGALTTLGTAQNADGRVVRLRLGRKANDNWGDPPLADTVTILSGFGAGWTVDEAELRLDLRDPTYWIERPVDRDTYAGTGGLAGTAALAGKRKPYLRGGSVGDPVREISPVLVDPVAGIYQVSDQRGVIAALYERGLAGGIVFNANVADITAAAPPAASYDVESSARGLFIRLGTFPPAGLITVDAAGVFPDTAAPTAAATVALEILRQDLGVPAANIDAASFATLATASPWAAGVYVGPDEALDGREIVGLLLRSSAARLVPRRNGTLGATLLRAVGATLPAVYWTDAEIVACIPRLLPAPMGPPPFRVRVGWGRNLTTQTSDLAPTLPGARRQELAEAYRVAVGANAAVTTAYRRPSDPALVETALTNGTAAQALADALRDLWCVTPGRRLYDVTLPSAIALARDIGDVVSVTYPGPLVAGAVGRIVGEQIRTADDLVTLQVLV